jgi:hypothetical protein
MDLGRTIKEQETYERCMLPAILSVPPLVTASERCLEKQTQEQAD